MNTQTLADLVGVERPSVSRWINGKSIPRGKNLEALSAALGVPEAQIAGYRPAKSDNVESLRTALTKALAARADIDAVIEALESALSGEEPGGTGEEEPRPNSPAPSNTLRNNIPGRNGDRRKKGERSA